MEKKSDTRDREIFISRKLNAPVELVWELWTKAEHIAKWWGPNGFTSTINTMDVIPGGEWNLVMHGPDGRDYLNKSIFREVIPHKRIVYEHVSYPRLVATIDFEEQGEQTLINWHMLFESAEQFIEVVKAYGAVEGLRQNVEKLEVYLARFNAKTFKTSGYAPVNGLKMYYEIHGAGTIPLVLIHGGGSTIESSFGKMLPLFSGYGKVIAVELQAHGRTSDRDAPESFEQDADDVAALLKYLKTDKADFFGFSNGGTTTLQIAIRHPDIVNKIVVASANYRRDGMIPGFFDGFPNATLADMPESLKQAYLKVAPDKNHLQVMFEKDVARMENFKDIPDDDIRSIKAPALILITDHDVIMPEHAVKLSRLLPGAQLVILPGVHGASVGALEAVPAKKGYNFPQITAALVEGFLNE
jgi:pimeloyl-ACP methyl ester carboxylesterase/uncharacterized protein YndB with AHSA1/START domain